MSHREFVHSLIIIALVAVGVILLIGELVLG